MLCGGVAKRSIPNIFEVKNCNFVLTSCIKKTKQQKNQEEEMQSSKQNVVIFKALIFSWVIGCVRGNMNPGELQKSIIHLHLRLL